MSHNEKDEVRGEKESERASIRLWEVELRAINNKKEVHP